MDYQYQSRNRLVHATTAKVQTQENWIKDPKNKETKLKAQEP